jgi:hypothetical protein
MLNELFTRVAALEAEMRAKKVDVPALVTAAEAKIEESTRKMCPHCGVKPNHFFHVKNCPEKNKNNGANPDQRRDSSKA